MNVLLLYPEIPATFWSYRHVLPIVRKRALSPPLGLLTVAALLPAHWHKRLIDLNIRQMSVSDVAWADLVLIGGMAIQRDSARRLIARCKALGKTVVAGGPLFTGEYALFPEVDHFVLNEAELTLPPFLADWERGRAARVYRTRKYADLQKSPAPLWELADLRQYTCMSVQFSRGCPYDCEFCNVTALFGRYPRVKTSQQIIAELESLWRLGWRESVFFVDDNLIGHRAALKNDLLPALMRWQKLRGPVEFITQLSVNLADDEALTRQIALAGFTTAFIGIESPDPASLAECGKNQNCGRDLIADVKRLQRAGIEVQGGFIVGFDHDGPSVFQRQVDLIQASGIVTAMVGLLQAPPGTRLMERLRRAGRLLGPSSGDNADGSTNVSPAMGLDCLREGYRRLLESIYSPRPYYQRIRRFLREYRPLRLRTTLGPQRFAAFLRSIWRLGILGRERMQYWGLLCWAILRKPALLPTAVRLAICGHHYRKMTNLLGA